MKTFLAIVLCLSVIDLPFTKATCSWTYNQTYITDTEINSEIFSYEATEVFEFTSWTVTDVGGGLSSATALTYFDHSITDKTFHVKTTDTFKNINNDAYTDGSNRFTITLTIQLTCDGKAASSSLLVQIENTNQNAPEFSKSSFTYSLPMPIMPKQDISLFGDEITATDVDFSTKEITFSVDPDDFVVNAIKTGNKAFRAVFSANQILKFTKSQIYTLTATDSGSPAKSSLAQITIDIDSTSSLDSPYFSSAYYSYNYTRGDPPSLIQTSEDIVIQSDKPGKATFALSGEYTDNFIVDFTNTSNTFSIALKSGTSLPESVSNQIVLTLSFTTDITVNAVIFLTIVEDESVPVFNSDYYVGTYDTDSNIISWNESIAVSDASDVTISGEKASLFTIDSTTFELKPTSSLSKDDFDDNSNLFLTLIASSTSKAEARAPVVISLLTPDELKFDRTYYNGAYQVTDDKGEVTLFDDIGFSDVTDFTDITIVVDNGYENNFGLLLDKTSSIYNVVVKQPLNESILSFNTHLIITVTASTSSSSSVFASTVLVLRLPSDSLPIFENNYYVATYKQSTSSSTDQIEINPDNIIKIKGSEFATAALSIEGYNDNFLGKCDSVTLECTISVQKNLNASIVSSNDELLVTLIASNNDGSKTGKTVLLINLPSKTSTFAFSKPHYFAIYTIQNADNDIATIALNDTISVTGADSSDITISLDGYTDQFSFDSNWNLNVNKNLDSQILSTKTELIVSLTAEKTDKTYSKATLVIKLPDRLTMASFSKAQYSGIYNIIDGTASVQLTDTSEIETTDINVQITLDSYDDNFEVKLSSDSKWTIQVKTPLAATVFTENAELKLIMTITKVSVKYGQASLLIKLPDPSFTKGFYIVEYTDGDVPSISGEDIVINNVDTANIQVNLSEYQEYIYTDLVEDKWVVKLSKPFSVEITSKREILLTILQAIRKSDNVQLATSTLVIKLPDLNTTGAPEFDKFTFNGDYKNSSDKPTVELTDLIGFSSTSTVTVATVVIEESSIYSSYFKLNPRTDGKYDVEVSENLPEDVLNTVTSIVLTLIASSEEGNQDFATLIINLPKVPRETSVQFIDEEILYSGTYENGTFKSPSITLKTNSTDDNKISVEITTELEIDNKYFNYTYKSKVLSLIVDTLPDDILKKYTFIPLKLAITDEDTGDTVHAVFNVNINYNSNDNGGGGGDDDDDDDKDSSTGLLVAVIILALLLVAVIVATILLWYFKIRNAKYVKMEEEEVEKQTTKPHPFTKNLSRQTSTSVPSDSSMRRPTGLPIGLIIPDSSTEEAVGDFEISPAPTAPMPENEKKVVFDDHVQNIDEYEVIEDEPSENFQNVADRRPTQFIFAYPMEAGLDSPTDADDDERRESSDFDGLDLERKKSVLFDENVERMHIDIDEEDDQDAEDEQDEQDEEDNEKNDKEKESYDVTKQGDLEKFKSELEVKLEEQIAIEILKETL